MAEEFKTLLKIEGDASGAKKAAAETKAATEQIGQVASTTAQQTTQATSKTTEAIEEKAKKTEKAKTGFQKMAESMGTSERAAIAFKEALARISPELAGLLDVGVKFEQIMSFGFSKIGLLVGGVTVAIGAVAFAFSKVEDAINRANESARRFAEQQERIRSAASQRQQGAVAGAAAAGLPPAAVGKVRELSRRLAERGIAEDTAKAVAPYFVDQAGAQVVPDEEAAAIAAAQQFGFIAPMAGAGRKRPIALQRAQRQMQRAETADLAANALANLTAETRARWEQMLMGKDEAAIREFVGREEGLAGTELDQRVATVIRQLKYGRGRGTAFGLSPGIRHNRFGDTPIEAQEDILTRTLRARARSFSDELVPAPTTQPAGEAARPTYIFNHGVQVFGRDNRDVQIPRIK